MSPGQQAEIIGFSSLNSNLKRKLLAMGLTPGVIITFLRQALCNGPIELQVRGACLAMRSKEAQCLVIKVIE